MPGVVQRQFGFRSIEPDVSTKSITCGRMFRMSGLCAETLALGPREATNKPSKVMCSQNLIMTPKK